MEELISQISAQYGVIGAAAVAFVFIFRERLGMLFGHHESGMVATALEAMSGQVGEQNEHFAKNITIFESVEKLVTTLIGHTGELLRLVTSSTRDNAELLREIKTANQINREILSVMRDIHTESLRGKK